MTEVPFSFNNKDNNILRGIVHIPQDTENTSTPRKGINIIVPGIKYRVAPNRLSVKLARYLCKNGWYVIRWDPSGIGESDGILDDKRREKEIFIDIQKGLFVDDTIAITQYFKEEYKLDEVIILGNCGGAVTALLSHNSTHAKRLVLIDLPIVFSLSTHAFSKEALRGGGYSDKIFNKYLSKVLNLRSWSRFLTFQSNHKVIFGLLFKKFANLLPSWNISKNRQFHNDIPKHTGTNEVINRPLFENFNSFIYSGGKALFICAQNDKSTPLLERYFLPYFYQEKLNINISKSIRKVTVPNANHIYTDIESQEVLLSKILNWLT